MPRGFWEAARVEPERVAVVDPDGTAHRAGDLLADANRLVHHLRSLGAGEGDPVATLLPNSVETFRVLLAVMQAGMQYVPLNTNLTLDEIRYVLDDSGAKVLVTDHEMTIMMEICETICVLDHGEVIAHGTPAAVRADERVMEAYFGR